MDPPYIIEFIKDYYSFEKIKFDYSLVVNRLKAFIRDGSLGKLWIIIYFDQPIGYIVLTYSYSLEHGRDAFIDEFFIEEAFRGKGIGKKTLEYVESYTRENEIKVLHLEVSHTNQDAQKLYSNWGFMKRDKYFLMSKKL